MPLWDALSGKVYRWNKTKDDAYRIGVVNLQAYEDELVREYAGSNDGSRVIRNLLFAYFFAGISTTSQQIPQSFSGIKDRFYSLSPQGILNFLSVFHGADVALRFGHDDAQLKLLLIGVCQVYRRPDAFGQSWIDCLDSAPDDPTMKIALKQCDDANAALGLDYQSVLGLELWVPFSAGVNAAFQYVYEKPDWPETAENEIRATLRL